MEYIIQTEQLTKRYAAKPVVDRVDLHVPKGEIYGFVGPNGTGKSTVMKMLLNLVQPDSGSIFLFGEKLTRASFACLGKIGSIIENPYFYEKMTARQNLELHCAYLDYREPGRIDEVLGLVNLPRKDGKKVAHYSLGMKQRLAIARAILARPEILLLDEPINALDPEGVLEMRLLFQNLRRELGTTIFISSHILSEVEQIADRIGILSGGRLLRELSLREIRTESQYLQAEVSDAPQAAKLLRRSRKDINLTVVNDHILRIHDPAVSGKEVSRLLVTNGLELESLSKTENSLESYFFQLTKAGE